MCFDLLFPDDQKICSECLVYADTSDTLPSAGDTAESTLDNLLPLTGDLALFKSYPFQQ